MPRSARTMAVCTVCGLVAATVYSVVFGGNGLVWFLWSVLALATVGVLTARRV
ncbi:hypothetical protein [Streptomyces sp. NPDC093097]|uniref:hypothetical protein n=1 Tax=Streptomyces sp. NPDC093097 TaxID=3366027 RepID=UPI0038234691